MESNATLKSNNFFTLLTDAIQLAALAKANAGSTPESMLSRASVISAIFSLECAANCVLSVTSGSSGFKKELDKLPVLTKWEYLFREKTRNCRIRPEFDKGSKPYQQVQELIGIRNAYVHPKVTSTNIDISNSGKWYCEGDLSPMLHVPDMSDGWSCDAAMKSVSAVIEFFNWYFIDLCKMTTEQVSGVLSPRVHVEANDDEEGKILVLGIASHKTILRSQGQVRFVSTEYVYDDEIDIIPVKKK